MDPSGPLSATLSRSFRLGPWSAEPARNQMRGPDGRTIRLEPKVMEVLAYLAARPGDVVPREELLQALWPGVVVGDDSLTQAIIKLRKAFGDTARAPRFIETVPKRGYRLVAAVRLDAPAAPPPGRGRSRWLAWSALALLVLFALVLSRPTTPPPVAAHQGLLGFHALQGGGGKDRELSASFSAELRHALARTPGLSLSSAGAEAGYRLNGELQPGDERVRILLRLVDDGVVVWSERFEREAAALHTEPERVAQQLAQAVAAALAEQETRRAARRYTRSIDAYKNFLNGRELSAWRREADGVAARELFSKAIAQDPTFARAYAAKAVSYARDYRYGFAGEAALERARSMANTALRIDPRLPEARFARAYVHLHRREHVAAERELDEALRLDPGYADAYGLKAHLYLDHGRTDEAIALLRDAMRLSSEHSQIHYLLLGRAFYFAGDAEQAFLHLREAKARNPADLEARLYCALTLAALGQNDSAQWEVEEIRLLRPGFRAEAWLRHYPLAEERMRREIGAALASLGL